MRIKVGRFGNRRSASFQITVAFRDFGVFFNLRDGLAITFSLLFWWAEVVFWGFEL